MLSIANVLVATDFSDSSASALAYGRELAGRFGARLHVLHAIDIAPLEFVETDALLSGMPDLRAEMETDAENALARLVTDEDRRLLNAATVIARHRLPAEAIVEYAAEHAVDLIIVGTHARRGVAHFLLGSVAEKVIRTAPCPVLTVRHPEREFVTPDAAGAAEERHG